MAQIIDPEKDLDIAQKILKSVYFSVEKIPQYYNYIYPWTNENIKNYYNYMDLNEKNSMVITSSGDHPIHASLAGSKIIDCFDINPLSKYYSALKVALLKTYDLKNFNKQFKTQKIKYFKIPIIIPIIKRIDLKELSPYLNDYEYYFWNGLIKNKKIQKSQYLFKYDGIYYNPIYNCAYFEPEIFLKAKKNLNNSTITYHDIDLSEERIILPNNYDCIFLSNVLEHLYSNFDRYNVIDNCLKNLKSNGKIITYSLNGCAKNFSCEQLIVTDNIDNAKIYKKIKDKI